MSTLTALRGPARVVVRQHRKALWAALALLLTGIGSVIAMRVWIAVRSSDELCPDGDMTPCGGGTYLPTYARTSTETFLSEGGTAMVLFAALVGAFVAGPLIARELDSGTFKFAWAQSVSPTRWLVARLALPLVLATAGCAVLMPVYHWGRAFGSDYPYAHGLERYAEGVYPGTGPVLLGYVVLAVALGALCALLLRRTLLAASTTTLLFGLVFVVMTKVRYRLWPPVRLTGGARPEGAVWHVRSGMLTPSGKEVGTENCFTVDGFVDHVACMRHRGGVTQFVDYHPASHFWPLQLVETGIVLVLAALAVVVAFRVLRHRTA
ncbi:MAG TPA: ABC transporter permease [Streptomyces sp.]|uniref:ABC transporter permease n=1 Tax=Streptomyces sp. TaxID=1931 RepID=UPI002C9B7BCC|nr:ABC transporter permease [Streptomyces sp.]HWU07029.1 ABC transporter permease [Streptomyces sp.]